MIRKILTVPNDVLLQKSKPVKKITSDTHKLIQDLKDTLIAQSDPIGVGISAVQIGVLQRIFLIRPDEDEDITVMINPQMTILDEKVASEKKSPNKERKKKRKPLLEGCLSIPEVWGHVLRPEKVQVEYMDEKGDMHTQNYSDFASIVVQHEYDHLNGILFTQRTLEQGYSLFKEEEDEMVPYSL